MKPVLFVNDNNDDLALCAMRADKIGVRSIISSDPQYILDTLKEGLVEHVFADVKMPTMMGDVFLTKLREKLPNQKCSLMSGYTNIEIELKAMAAGFRNILPKDEPQFTYGLKAILGV